MNCGVRSRIWDDVVNNFNRGAWAFTSGKIRTALWRGTTGIKTFGNDPGVIRGTRNGLLNGVIGKEWLTNGIKPSFATIWDINHRHDPIINF